MTTPPEPRMADFPAFLNRIIGDGISAAKRDYRDDEPKRDGSVAGFESCRGKTPEQLAALLVEAGADRMEAYRNEADDYWYWRCREAEIEWVCNVVSAALLNAGYEVIVPPTARGVLKAGEILGVGTPDG